MNKLSKVLMTIAIAVIVGVIGKAVVLDEAVKGDVLMFFAVGSGLALVRIAINQVIAKMKGQHLIVKIGFFATLLSVGIPFQNWFRTDVLFAINPSFIVPSITVMVASLVFMTVLASWGFKHLRNTRLEGELSEVSQ